MQGLAASKAKRDGVENRDRRENDVIMSIKMVCLHNKVAPHL